MEHTKANIKLAEPIQLIRFGWKELLDGSDYLFKNGGSWMVGMYDKDYNHISTEDHYINEDEVDDGILYELPE